jgi:hypothetical protein
MWRFTVLLALAVAACGGGSRSSCGSVDSGVLPSWARTGFSDKQPKIAHVMGAGGSITAILFAQPLTAPPEPDRGNKILWVSKFGQSGPADLHITARRGDQTVRRVVTGGPGPSIIDLPASGCWQLSLSWDGHRDSLALNYVKA